MQSALAQLYDEHAVAAYEKQLRLSDRLEGLAWRFDGQAGQLEFGVDLAFPAELLGIEQAGATAWRWGWACAGAAEGPARPATAERLRALGREREIASLVEAEVPLGENLSSHDLAMLASGLSGAVGYFHAPLEAGAAVFLLRGAMPPSTDPPAERILRVFPQAIAQCPITSHLRALEGYAAALGLTCRREGPRLHVALPADRAVLAEFDPADRLVTLRVP